MKSFSAESAIRFVNSIISNPIGNIGNIGLLGCAVATIGCLNTIRYQSQKTKQSFPVIIEDLYYLQSASFLSISLGYALRDISSYTSIGLIAFGSIGSLINIRDDHEITHKIPLPLYIPGAATLAIAKSL